MTLTLHNQRELDICLATLLEAQRIVDQAPRDKAVKLFTDINTFTMQAENLGYDTQISRLYQRKNTSKFNQVSGQANGGNRVSDSSDRRLNHDSLGAEIERFLNDFASRSNAGRPESENTPTQCGDIPHERQYGHAALMAAAVLIIPNLIGWMI